MLDGQPSQDRLDVSLENNRVVLALIGEFDFGNVGAVTHALYAAGADTDAPVVIDIGNVTFLDSSILRTIILFQQRLAESDRSLTVRNASAQSRKVFEITHLDHLLEKPPVEMGSP
jgi:anti-anti-sigma factor